MKKAILVALVAIAAASTSVQVMAADGKAVFEKSCKGCHTGMNPKMGDKAAWAPLIARGEKELVASVMKGKGMMPAKGNAGSADDVTAAVKYMMDAVK